MPRRGIMVCCGKKSRGFPLPPQVCSTDSTETQARTPCPWLCPWAWAHTPSSYSRQEGRATHLPQLRYLAALPLLWLDQHPCEGACSHLPPSTPGRKHEDPDLLATSSPGPFHTKLEGWHAGLLLPCHTASCYTSKEFWLKSKKHYPEKKANCE